MPDSDKVIKGLETIRYNLLQMKHMLLADFCDDALDLLKEQDNCENCAIAIEDRKPIVRCKQCKFGEACKNGAGEQCVQCFNDDLSMTGDLHMPDWFCADAERREE